MIFVLVLKSLSIVLCVKIMIHVLISRQNGARNGLAHIDSSNSSRFGPRSSLVYVDKGDENDTDSSEHVLEAVV